MVFILKQAIALELLGTKRRCEESCGMTPQKYVSVASVSTFSPAIFSGHYEQIPAPTEANYRKYQKPN